MNNRLKIIVTFLFVIGLLQINLFAKTTATFTISGTVKTSTNVAIADVMVSDGISVVKTNANGQYTLSSNDLAKFVFVTIPADCKIPHENNIPKFYKEIKGTKSNITVDFILEKQAKDNFFVLTTMADPQPQVAADLKRFQDEAIPDFEALKNYYPANTPIVGFSAGDIVWDMPSFYAGIKTGLSKLSFPYFQVIGNHDHDETVKNNDYLASRNFETHFGPTYYSFDRANVHFIALDNIVYRTRTDYDETITAEQLSWVQKDLSFVPKNKLIVISMHSPGYSSATKPKVTNIADLTSLLQGYKVIFISGHTHKMNKVVVNNNITEYTLAPTMGYKWSGDIHTNGCPMGYGVFEFQDNQLVNQYYMATKREPSYQMEVYPIGAITNYPNSIVAHVWNYSSGWKVQVYEDNVFKGSMTNITGIDPYANDYFLGTTKPIRDKSLEPTDSKTLFLYSPKDKTAEIKVVVTDNFNNVYTEYLNKKSTAAPFRQVFFTESGGEGAGGGVNILSWSKWHNENIGYSNGDCSNLPDLRDTYPSSDVSRSFYTDIASGSNNIYYQAETPNGIMRGFAIDGINASAYKNIELSFGYNKQKEGTRGEMDVYYWNGFKWVQLSSQLKEEIEPAGWYRSPIIKLPKDAERNDLRLRFVKPPTTDGSIRIDDIWLTGEPILTEKPTILGFSNTSDNEFLIDWENYPDATNYLIDVSKNESFTQNDSFETLVAWTFPNGYSDGTLATPNIYSANNQNKFITVTASGNASNPNPYQAGSTTDSNNPLAISSTGWEDGVYKKYFQIDVDATDFYDLTLSSWNYSSANGPKNMKIQYRTNENSIWIDVPNSDLIMPNAAYNEVSKLEDLSLPSACNNQKNLSLRWVMSSSLRTSGDAAYIVTSGGTSRIANIFVKGKEGSFVGGYKGMLLSNNSYTISGLEPNQTYYARVQATDGKMVSNVSDYVKILTNTSSLSNLEQKQTTISYNQLQEKIYVQLPDRYNFAELQLWDSNGRLIKNQKISGSPESTISVSDILQGVYIMTLNVDNNRESYKIIK